MRSNRYRAARLRLALFAALAVGLASLASAVGDYFIPLPAPSQIQVLASPAAFAPDQETSEPQYTLSIGISNEAGVSNIKSVNVCWYDDIQIDYGVGPVTVDPTNCLVDSTIVDERYTALMTWDGTDGNFHIGRLNHSGLHDDYYRNAGSMMTGNGNTGTWDFKFTISEAMHKSDKWRAYIEVCDFADQCSVDQSVKNVSVAWYGYMYEPNQQADFGVINIGTWGFAVRTEGRPMVNGAAFVTYESTGFSDLDGNQLPLMNIGLPGSPASTGKVALDCTGNPDSYYQAASLPQNPDFSGPNWLRVTGQPQRAYENAFAMGMYEDGDSGMGNDFGCALYYPGGAAKAGVQFNSTFTVGVGEYTN